MTDVLVAMLRLIQGICSIQWEVIPWEIGCYSEYCFGAVDTGYLLLEAWEVWMEFLVEAQKTNSQNPG